MFLRIFSNITAMIITITMITVFCNVTASDKISKPTELNAKLLKAVTKKKCKDVINTLKRGANANMKFVDYSTKVSMPIIFIPSTNNDICTLKALVKYGGDIESRSYMRMDSSEITTETPLAIAIRMKRIESIKALLELNADLHARDKNGKSIVNMAFQRIESQVQYQEEKHPNEKYTPLGRTKLEKIRALLR